MRQSNIWLGVDPPQPLKRKKHKSRRPAPVDYTCRAAYHYSLNDFKYNRNRSTVDVLTGQ